MLALCGVTIVTGGRAASVRAPVMWREGPKVAEIPCDMCGQELAIMLQTSLSDGETVGVGEACIIGFYMGVLTELTAGMPTEVAEHYTEPLAIIIKNVSPSLLDLAATTQRRPRGKKASTPADSAAICQYCNRPLDDGESHLHGGQPNPADANGATADHAEVGTT